MNNNIIHNMIFRKSHQHNLAKKLQINNPNGIVEAGFVKLGDIEQWVTIRGEDKNNPVVLFIHGGPGSTYSIFSPLLRSWEKYFTIVQWDQRGAGKTFKKNGQKSSGKLSFDRLANDGIELTEYLCKKMKQEKLILIGSSVGSLIALMMAKYRPELFYAYVGTDQNAPDPENLSYYLTLEALRDAGDKNGLELIQKMGPERAKWPQKSFEKRNQHLVKAKKEVPNMVMDLMLPNMLTSPDHKITDLVDLFKGMSFSLDHLYDELINFDVDKLGLTFELPFFIFQGEGDIITPTALAERYFSQIIAPVKDFVLIQKAGHLACFAQPDQFLEELRQRVKPLLAESSDQAPVI